MKSKFPLRLFLTGSLTLGSVLTIISYNIAGIRGIWIIAAIIWGFAAYSFVRIRRRRE